MTITANFLHPQLCFVAFSNIVSGGHCIELAMCSEVSKILSGKCG